MELAETETSSRILKWLREGGHCRVCFKTMHTNITSRMDIEKDYCEEHKPK